MLHLLFSPSDAGALALFPSLQIVVGPTQMTKEEEGEEWKEDIEESSFSSSSRPKMVLRRLTTRREERKIQLSLCFLLPRTQLDEMMKLMEGRASERERGGEITSPAPSFFTQPHSPTTQPP